MTISGRTLLVDGSPFEVRGMAYSPLLSYAERETSPHDQTFSTYSSIWERDLTAMASMGVNTPGQAVGS